jgi:uncharacterized protein
MKKILYLHGLETRQGGRKVGFLSKDNYVHAPKIDYTRKDIFPFLIQIMDDFKPDLIIGSSMGGYAAYILSGFYGTPIIAFNPALHSRKFDLNLPSLLPVTLDKKMGNSNLHTTLPSKVKIILGKEDTVINPEKTKNYLNNNIKFPNTLEVEEVEGVGHRIPFNLFVDIYNKHIK